MGCATGCKRWKDRWICSTYYNHVWNRVGCFKKTEWPSKHWGLSTDSNHLDTRLSRFPLFFSIVEIYIFYFLKFKKWFWMKGLIYSMWRGSGNSEGSVHIRGSLYQIASHSQVLRDQFPKSDSYFVLNCETISASENSGQDWLPQFKSCWVGGGYSEWNWPLQNSLPVWCNFICYIVYLDFETIWIHLIKLSGYKLKYFNTTVFVNLWLILLH